MAVERSFLMLAALVSVASSASAKISHVPFLIKQASGARPFVRAKLNGMPLLMMVHANAGFYVMTGHANAARAGVDHLISSPGFGIDKPGHVSPLGRAKASLRTLQVGPSVVHDVPLSVFETPTDLAIDGMLGIQWLRVNRVIVDFKGRQLGFARRKDDAADLGRSLRARGYTAHRMKWEEKARRYTVEGSVNGVAVQVLVSTVAENIVGLSIARRASMPMEAAPEDGNASGPKGSTQNYYISHADLPLRIDEQQVSPHGALIYDQGIYEGEPGKPAPVEPSVTLGADFMLGSGAIIDYGSEILYLRG